jgi:hypothetical protein
MKHFFLFLCTSILIFACDPPKSAITPTAIDINAQVINPKTTINLGDSVAFYFEVPDSVTINGTKTKVNAGSSDGADIGLYACKINPTAIAGFETNSIDCKKYVNPGSISAVGNLLFANQNGKLLAKIFFIPQKKGVYFFEQSQYGYIGLNNGSLNFRFSFNFGNINRNHQMLIDSAGVANKFDLFLQGKISQNLEVYGFRVN